jgi:hypothetical protein
MFQQGLSQSLVWQRGCADWVQPRLCEALWRSKAERNMRATREGAMKCAKTYSYAHDFKNMTK